MTNTLIVRMSKNVFLKDKKYTITVNDTEQTHTLNITRNKIEIDLNSQTNKIEISNENNSKIFLINNIDNNVKFLNIYTNLTYDLALGVLIGFAFVASVIILLLSIRNGINLLLIFITFLPLLFLKKDNFEDGFTIKELNK